MLTTFVDSDDARIFQNEPVHVSHDESRTVIHERPGMSFKRST